MDVMKIKSGFMRGIVGKIFAKMLNKNLGCDVTINIQELEINNSEDIAKIHINLDGYMTPEELKKLVKKFGL